MKHKFSRAFPLFCLFFFAHPELLPPSPRVLTAWTGNLTFSSAKSHGWETREGETEADEGERRVKRLQGGIGTMNREMKWRKRGCVARRRRFGIFTVCLQTSYNCAWMATCAGLRWMYEFWREIVISVIYFSYLFVREMKLQTWNI